MKYPSWAPRVLVHEHIKLLDAGMPQTLADEIIQARKKNEGDNLPNETEKKIRQQLERVPFASLPVHEKKELLKRMVTDERMKDVWKSLEKRVKDKFEYRAFWNKCEQGVLGWRGTKKKWTQSEFTRHMQSVHEAVIHLSKLLYDAPDFEYFSLIHLIDDEKLESLLDALNIDIPTETLKYNAFDEEGYCSYVRYSLNNSLPRLDEIFSDISIKALEHSQKSVIVKKPNAKNADIHYFVRTLSGYLTKKYGQPLHQVVATTTTVIFDRQEIDADLVRRLVNK